MPKAEEILKDLEEKRDSIRKARKVLSELKTDKEEFENIKIITPKTFVEIIKRKRGLLA